MRASEFLSEVTRPDQPPSPGQPDFEKSKEFMMGLIKNGIEKYNQYLTTLKASSPNIFNSLLNDQSQILSGVQSSIMQNLIANGAGNITQGDTQNLMSAINLKLPANVEAAPTLPQELMNAVVAARMGTGPKLSQEQYKMFNAWAEKTGNTLLPASYAEPADTDEPPPSIADGEKGQFGGEDYVYTDSTWYEVNKNTGRPTKPAPLNMQKLLTQAATKKTESVNEGVVAWDADIPSIQISQADIEKAAQFATEIWYHNRYQRATGTQQQAPTAIDPIVLTFAKMFQIDPNDKEKIIAAMADAIQDQPTAKKIAAKLNQSINR